MTTTIEEKITVMLAFAAGKTIEFKNLTYPNSNWGVVETPLWDWNWFAYRVAKKKTKQYKRYISTDGDVKVFTLDQVPLGDTFKWIDSEWQEHEYDA
jgi:hypothetical protein